MDREKNVMKKKICNVASIPDSPVRPPYMQFLKQGSWKCPGGKKSRHSSHVAKQPINFTFNIWHAQCWVLAGETFSCGGVNLQILSRTAAASVHLCRQKSVASVAEHYHEQEATRGHKVVDGSRQAANLQCKGGEKKHKQNSLLNDVAKCGAAFVRAGWSFQFCTGPSWNHFAQSVVYGRELKLQICFC